MSNKEKYWKYSLIVFILTMGLILFRELTPYMGGFLGAITIYTLVRGQMHFLTDKWRMPRSLAALLITLEAILCFLVPLSLVVWIMVKQMQSVNLDPHALIAPIQKMADIILVRTGFDILGNDTLTFLISSLPQVGKLVMGSISSLVINLFVLVFVLYFMLTGGKKMEEYVSDLLPFNRANTADILKEFKISVRSNAVGIPLLAVIQGGIAMLGYWFFGVPNIFLAGLLTCFATVIPMVGTSLVWLPIGLYMGLSGDWVNGIGLWLFGGIVISQLDNLIRFILQKQMADTHPLITVFGVVIGLPLFGFMGIIFGPLLLSLFLLFIDIFKREYLDERS